MLPGNLTSLTSTSAVGRSTHLPHRASTPRLILVLALLGRELRRKVAGNIESLPGGPLVDMERGESPVDEGVANAGQGLERMGSGSVHQDDAARANPRGGAVAELHAADDGAG